MGGNGLSDLQGMGEITGLNGCRSGLNGPVKRVAKREIA